MVFLETQARKDLKETLETLDSQDNLEFLVRNLHYNLHLLDLILKISLFEYYTY